MRLYLLRHAQAEPQAASDAQRVLTALGQAQAEATALWLQQRGLAGLRIVASPYRRAQQTAATVAAALGCTVESQPLLTPEQDARVIARWLGEQGDAALLLVSHMPVLAELDGWLQGGVLEGQPFGLAEVRELDMDLVGAAQATLHGRYSPY